jgi:Protein of unknown function (DUF3667).
MGVVEDEERRVGERRTMALRGPGAGGFTPAHSVAASNPCLNCGTNVQLSYCPECGQPEIDSDPTLKEFLHELAEEFLHWDGKLAKTFRLLVTRPGALTNEYLAGRRVRYISPLRVYLTCSLLFFFLGAIVPRSPEVVVGSRVTGERAVVTHVGVVTIGERDSAATIASLDSLAAHGRWVGRVWGKHFANAMRNRGALSAAVTSWIPKAMFILVPLFAALVMLAFRRYRRRFPQHLAFALHVHAFLFLLLSVALVRRVTPSAVVQVAVMFTAIVATLVYVVKAMRTVYGVSTGGAIGRTAFIASTYFAAFLAAMILTFGLIVLLQF